MLFLLVAFHIIVSIGLIVLILMHSGREGGLGGLGFTPTSHGGTHIVERMLTRYTVALAVIWFLDTVALFRLLK
jgi:preprotein translocase subunit SecG